MTNEANMTNAAENLAATTAGVADACVKQTMAGLSDGLARASAGFEQTQAKLVKNTESAMTKAAAMVSGNLEALTRSGQIWATGVQDLSSQVIASFQSSLRDTSGAIKTLTTVKSLREVMELQSGLARNALDKTMSESGRLTQASLKLAEQALAPVFERARISGQTFGSAV